jgi:hypothetical protein
MPNSDQDRTSSQAVTRQELYDMAWQMPMLRVAERFGVSSSYLARVFTELRIPRPPPGYWAQVEFGKSPARPSLPPARPGELTEWSPGTSVGATVRSLTKVVQTDEKSVVPAAAQTASVEAAAPRSKRKARVSNAENLPKRHELLTGVRPFFLKSRKVENDILRPFKRLLVDVLASEKMLDAVLDATQALFDACVRRGHHVGIAGSGLQMRRTDIDLLEKPSSRHYHRAVWSPERPTLVHVGGVAIGLTVFEMTEEVEVVYVNGKYLPVRDLSYLQLRRYTGTHHWRSKEEHASGRICLQAYCPSWRVTWAKRWPELKQGTFQSMVPQIVSELEGQAPDLARQLEEARIRAEEEHRRWEEERRRREEEAERQRREKARQDAKRDLLVAIEAWDEARRIADFFRAAELMLNQGIEGTDAAALDRLRLAKELIGQPDPLALLKSWKAPEER